LFFATAPPSPPTKENLTNPTVTETNLITDPPDPTSLMDGQRILSLQTRLSQLG
jgi:hypothetical protein